MINILCIGADSSASYLVELLAKEGVRAEMINAVSAQGVVKAMQHASDWDLVLCEAARFFDWEVGELLHEASTLGAPPGSLILLKSRYSRLSPAEAIRRGAVDVVLLDDYDHLFWVCRRELKNVQTRRKLLLLQAGEPGNTFPSGRQVSDISAAASDEDESREEDEAEQMPVPVSEDEINSLVDSGKLFLEFQPIIPLMSDENARPSFEVLVRLQDRSGRSILPRQFLSVLADSGRLEKMDLWIYRRALEFLAEQGAESKDTALFINLAPETLHSLETIKEIIDCTNSAKVAPGSIVLEVHSSAFTDGGEIFSYLTRVIRSRGHKVLLEDPPLQDPDFLKRHARSIAFAKLGPSIVGQLVQDPAMQERIRGFVKMAHRLDIRVIALAVDRAGLLPLLCATGIDAIQGNFVSTPQGGLDLPEIPHIVSNSPGIFSAH